MLIEIATGKKMLCKACLPFGRQTFFAYQPVGSGCAELLPIPPWPRTHDPQKSRTGHFHHIPQCPITYRSSNRSIFITPSVVCCFLITCSVYNTYCPIKRTLSPSAISVRRIFLRSIRGSEHDTAGFSAGHRGIQQRFLTDGGEIPAFFKSARVVLLNECQSFF